MSITKFGTDRGGVELAGLARQYRFPDFVKHAGSDLLADDAPAGHCADQERGLWPCHTKAACWLSHLFALQGPPRPAAQARLAKYAAYWHIVPEVEALRQRHAELARQAALPPPDHYYAYVKAAADGGKERRLPLKSAAETAVAARWLATHAGAFPWDERRVMAGRILEKAAQYGAALGEAHAPLERLAGLGVPDLTKLAAALDRRGLLANGDGRAAFGKLAAWLRAKEARALHPETLLDLVKTIDGLDRALFSKGGAAVPYSAALPLPEDVVYAATFRKAAEEVDDVVALQDGSVFKKAEFKKLAYEDLEALFGSAFARASATGLDVDHHKAAAAARGLAAPDAARLGGLLAEAGAGPLLRKAASAQPGRAARVRAALAGHYRRPAPPA